MNPLFAKENVTFLLAIVGSIGTVSSWIYYWLTTRKKFRFEVSNYKFNEKGILLYFLLTNNSRLPIAVNDISILIFSSEFHCPKIPVKVLETLNRVGKEVVSRKEFFSVSLPLNLPPLCGDSGYLYFPFEKQISEPAPTQLTFVIRTNRGKEWKSTLPLDKVLE